MTDQHDDDAMKAMIQELDSVLHPETSQPPFLLTEAMVVPPKSLNDKEQQQVISEVSNAIQELLPKMIGDAVEQVLTQRVSNNA
ncbi:MAG: hypothetical protein R8J84_09050 [Mariprofundales bacterium]